MGRARVAPAVSPRAVGAATRSAYSGTPAAPTASPEAMSSLARSMSPRAADATASPATRPASRYQIANAPSSSEPRTTSSSQLERGADVLERRPVGEVGEEVRHVVVRRRRRRACCGRRSRPGRRRPPRARCARRGRGRRCRTRRCRPAAKTLLGRRAQPAVAAHAAELAELQAGLAREHDVGQRADAARPRPRRRSCGRRPVTTRARARRRRRPRRRSARPRRRRRPRRRAPRARARKHAPARAPKRRSSGSLLLHARP